MTSYWKDSTMSMWLRRLVRVAGVAIVVLLFSAPVGLVEAALVWQTEVVAVLGDVGQDTSLALDNNGRPHVSFYDVTNGDLVYANHTSPIWILEFRDAEGDVGQYSSLAVDGQDRPHISYYDVTNGDLKYAAFDGTDWQIETVDADGDVGAFTSLALDSEGQPHISYYDRSNGNLRYATYDGSTWQIETVDAAIFSGWFTSLALDSAGQPHISYLNFLNSDLKYAAFDGSAWQIETVDVGGFTGYHTSLALDSQGRPHISYLDADNGNLEYATFDGTDWQIETVDGDDFVGEYTSLALDSQDRPHISYFDGINSDLKFAAFDGSAWQIETVTAEGIVGEFNSLALDSTGQPHISYYDNTNGDLRYAWAEQTQHPPAVGAGGSYTADEGSPVSLDGAVSDAENDPLTTSWSYTIDSADPGTVCSFADAAQADTIFTCTDDGSFSVKLEATDGFNPAVSDTATVTISNVAPTVALGDDVEIFTGDTYTGTGSFSDPGANDTHAALVYYGDGSGEQSLTLKADGSFDLNHTYQSAGSYLLSVCVADDDDVAGGCDTLVVSVVNAPLTVEVGGPFTGTEGSGVTLDASVANGNPDTSYISWFYVVDSADPGTTCTLIPPLLADTNTFTCTDDGDFR